MQLEEIRSEPVRNDPAQGVEPDVVPKPAVAPQPRKSARLRSVRDVLLLDSDGPVTYAEAMSRSESESWQEAMGSELKSMDENQVWNLIDPPFGVKAIECKWVFKKKTDKDGNCRRYAKWGIFRHPVMPACQGGPRPVRQEAS